jgi:hypothetical protein
MLGIIFSRRQAEPASRYHLFYAAINIYKKNVDQIGFIYYILVAKNDSPPREGKLPQ